MRHIGILIHVLTLLSGIMTALLGYLLYLKYKIKEIKYYSVFILTTTFTVAFTTVYNYLSYFMDMNRYSVLLMAAFLLFEMFIIMINYTFTLFALGIVSKRFTLFNKLLIGIPSIMCFASFIIPAFINMNQIMQTVYQILSSIFMIVLFSLFISFIYNSIRIAISLKSISNQDLRKALKVLALLFVVFIPAQGAIVMFVKQWEVIMLARNTLYLLINIISIVYAAKYFFIDAPSIMEHIKISESFIRKYSITNREKEVIELLMTGLSIKEVSAKLDRSFKTVNNHIYNIYKKTDVTSKMELLNKIKENSF